MRWLCLVCVALTLVGCTTLTTIQECDYQKMKTEGVLVEEKNPALAAALGILPGCGSFYTGNYVLGAVDVVTWPLSILWDPIAGYNEARVRNYRATQFAIERDKKRELIQLEAARDEGRITQVEFNQNKRALETRHSFE